MNVQLQTGITTKTKHITLPIYNLSCGGGGVLVIERILSRTPGVIEVYANPATEMAYIEYDPTMSTSEQLAAVIVQAGFGPPVALRQVR